MAIYKIDKKIEKIDTQIEELLNQKKHLEEIKKENKKELSETKKKQYIRLGKVLDEAGITTIKELKNILKLYNRKEENQDDKNIKIENKTIENIGKNTEKTYNEEEKSELIPRKRRFKEEKKNLLEIAKEKLKINSDLVVE